MTPYPTTPCKACKKPILFAETHEGKKIPLDTVAPVYQVLENIGKPQAHRAEGYYVSHFCTCPQANQFSAGKRP